MGESSEDDDEVHTAPGPAYQMTSQYGLEHSIDFRPIVAQAVPFLACFSIKLLSIAGFSAFSYENTAPWIIRLTRLFK